MSARSLPSRRCTCATLRRRSRRISEVGEPIVDATPRGVRVRVLEGVERIGGGFYAQFELVVGAVVADENRDGVVSSDQRSVTWMPAFLRLASTLRAVGLAGA